MVSVYSIVVAYNKRGSRGKATVHTDHLGWRRDLAEAKKLGRKAAEVMADVIGSARYSVALASKPNELIVSETVHADADA